MLVNSLYPAIKKILSNVANHKTQIPIPRNDKAVRDLPWLQIRDVVRQIGW